MRFDPDAERAVRVATEMLGDAFLVRVSGQVDDLGSDAVSAAVDEVLDARHKRVLFDLSDVRYLGSSGLGQIMRAYQAVKNRGGYVRIINPQPLIADVFRLTKLEKILKIYPSVEAALQDPP